MSERPPYWMPPGVTQEMIDAAQKYDLENRWRGWGWGRVPDYQVARIIAGYMTLRIEADHDLRADG